MQVPLARRIAWMLAATLLAGTNAHAGIETLGLRAGMSSSRLMGDFGESYGGDFQHGFMAGAYVRFPLGGAFSFQPEFAWIGKGGDGVPGSFTSPGPPPEVTEFHVQTRIQYIEFPLLARLELPAAGGVRSFLVAGPAPAIKLSVSQVVEARTYPAAGPARSQRPSAFIFEDVGTLGRQPVAPFDLGLVGGAGTAVEMGGARVVLEGRYTHGLIDMIEGSGAVSRNAGFTLTLGVEQR